MKHFQSDNKELISTEQLFLVILIELLHNKNKGINMYAGVFTNFNTVLLNFTPTQYKYITVKIYNNITSSHPSSKILHKG